ncbi:unnamed protein product [Arctogadus glacialis]
MSSKPWGRGPPLHAWLFQLRTVSPPASEELGSQLSSSSGRSRVHLLFTRIHPVTRSHAHYSAGLRSVPRSLQCFHPLFVSLLREDGRVGARDERLGRSAQRGTFLHRVLSEQVYDRLIDRTTITRPCSNSGRVQLPGVVRDGMLYNATLPRGPPGNASDPWDGRWERVLVPVLDALILVLGLWGHSLVMVVLCGRRRRRGGLAPGAGSSRATGPLSGTDVLLVALSAADLLLLAVLPFHSAAMALRYWPFGAPLCRLVGFVGAACASASSYTLAALAVSRYLTVVRPALAHRLLSARRVALAAALLWAPACALAGPQLAFRSAGAPGLADGADGPACLVVLPHGGQVAYGLSFFLLSFLLPLATIAAAYLRVFLFLWRRRRRGGGARAPQVERYQSRVTQTSALLVLAFTLCWLPSYGLTLALLVGQDAVATGASPRYGPFVVFARLTATSSTVANPVLYVLMSRKFRRELLGLMCRRGRGGRGAVSVATVS